MKPVRGTPSGAHHRRTERSDTPGERTDALAERPPPSRPPTQPFEPSAPAEVPKAAVPPDLEQRMVAGALEALKAAAQTRQHELAQAEAHYGPVETWTDATLHAHRELRPLLAYAHLQSVRDGDLDKAAAVASHHDHLSPSKRDTFAATWHSVRDKAVEIAKDIWEFMKHHPKKTALLAGGAAAIVAVALLVAPALAAAVAESMGPVLGATGAKVLGTSVGGAVASGARSLVVNAAPMVVGADEFNGRQLATDTLMSAGFGFLGFAQAQALKDVASVLEVSGLTHVAFNAVGLIGIEVIKDFFQNAIRNKWGGVSAPKSWGETVDPQTGEVRPGIWKQAVISEAASNLLRAIPGMETNFALKMAGDVGGSLWWNRIVNAHEDRKVEAQAGVLTPVAPVGAG